MLTRYTKSFSRPSRGSEGLKEPYLFLAVQVDIVEIAGIKILESRGNERQGTFKKRSCYQEFHVSKVKVSLLPVYVPTKN